MTQLTATDWRVRADSLSFRSQAFIDGRFVDAASGETFDTISPVDGRVLASITACDSEDVNRAVAAARAAFEDGRWSRRAPAERKAVLLAFADLIRAHRDEPVRLRATKIPPPWHSPRPPRSWRAFQDRMRFPSETQEVKGLIRNRNELPRPRCSPSAPRPTCCWPMRGPTSP